MRKMRLGFDEELLDEPIIKTTSELLDDYVKARPFAFTSEDVIRNKDFSLKLSSNTRTALNERIKSVSKDIKGVNPRDYHMNIFKSVRENDFSWVESELDLLYVLYKKPTFVDKLKFSQDNLLDIILISSKYLYYFEKYLDRSIVLNLINYSPSFTKYLNNPTREEILHYSCIASSHNLGGISPIDLLEKYKISDSEFSDKLLEYGKIKYANIAILDRKLDIFGSILSEEVKEFHNHLLNVKKDKKEKSMESFLDLKETFEDLEEYKMISILKRINRFKGSTSGEFEEIIKSRLEKIDIGFRLRDNENYENKLNRTVEKRDYSWIKERLDFLYLIHKRPETVGRMQMLRQDDLVDVILYEGKVNNHLLSYLKEGSISILKRYKPELFSQ